MMEEEYGAYTDFARVYDLFMDNVPYGEWADYLEKILKEAGIREGLLLDLGCGTGRLTRLMAQKGYDMIGVDVSGEMLEMAREAERKAGQKPPKDILYLQQDMRSFELYGTVRAIYSACDCVNYITDPKELLGVFRLVNNYLDPGGLFIFDCNTTYKYEQLLGENTFAENRQEGSFIWENYYDPADRINEYDLTLYIQCGDRRYQRFQETHFQRCYSERELLELLEEAGMTPVAVYEGYTCKAPGPDSQRITVVAREKGKRTIPQEGQKTNG